MTSTMSKAQLLRRFEYLANALMDLWQIVNAAESQGLALDDEQQTNLENQIEDALSALERAIGIVVVHVSDAE